MARDHTGRKWDEDIGAAVLTNGIVLGTVPFLPHTSPGLENPFANFPPTISSNQRNQSIGSESMMEC